MYNIIHINHISIIIVRVLGIYKVIQINNYFWRNPQSTSAIRYGAVADIHFENRWDTKYKIEIQKQSKADHK